MTCSCDAWPRCSQPSDEGPGGLCAECRAVGHLPVARAQDVPTMTVSELRALVTVWVRKERVG